MSLNTSLMRDWLKAQTTKPWFVTPFDDEMPDVHGLITVVPGPGMLREGTFYNAAIQLSWLGKQRVNESAEDFARSTDEMLMDSMLYPHSLWGCRVLSCDWVGGAPSPVQRVDAGRRATWTCTYLFDASR